MRTTAISDTEVEWFSREEKKQGGTINLMEWYRKGYADAIRQHETGGLRASPLYADIKKKRKLSAWQKFVKANSKKPRFKYKSGSKKGRINLKALGVAYRKKRR